MLKSLKLQDLRQKTWQAVDTRVRAITAGLGLNELRNLMRGEPPTEKPNPRYKVHTTSFLFHIRPRYYEAGSTILTHTFRLGFFTSFFFFVELFTGLILMVYYTPSPEKAYPSILDLANNVPFGQMLRDIHRLGAEGMVIFTVLHMLRTYLDRVVQERALLHLADRGGLAGHHHVPELQRLFAALGPAGLLGGDRRHQHGRSCAAVRQRGQPAAARRAGYRRQRPAALLPAACCTVAAGRHPGDQHSLLQSLARARHLAAGRMEEGEVPPEVKKAAKQRIDFIPDLLTSEVFYVAWVCCSWCWG